MNYGTLAKMKKEFDTYTNANKQHIIYNFNMLKMEGLTDRVIEQLKEEVYNNDAAMLTNKDSYLNRAVDTVNNCLLSVNMYFKVVSVYNAKTSKRLYIYKEVIGYEISKYLFNRNGVIPENAYPDEVITQGSIRHPYYNRVIEDVEI